ncbi:MAG: gamma-glutamylcyclotransferase family protein [Erythrobacter sp.]|uniref:gamma-glutamylcyclotransferase family protein n=1 Tax=Erythrobacter sp. TaxID=1042 RepID=UPI0032635212
MTNPAHLFFYGVLQEGLGPDGGDWPFLKGLGMGAPATTQGALYAIPTPHGWHPALILTQARYSAIVHGAIHEASHVDMGPVDEFEGPSYTRQAVPVDGWDGYGDTCADAYIWTDDLPEDAELIASGDFAQWLQEKGRPIYSGG